MLFASDRSKQSARDHKVPVCGAAHEARHKPRRLTQCAGETYCHSALKNAKPAGTSLDNICTYRTYSNFYVVHFDVVCILISVCAIHVRWFSGV